VLKTTRLGFFIKKNGQFLSLHRPAAGEQSENRRVGNIRPLGFEASRFRLFSHIFCAAGGPRFRWPRAAEGAAIPSQAAAALSWRQISVVLSCPAHAETCRVPLPFACKLANKRTEPKRRVAVRTHRGRRPLLPLVSRRLVAPFSLCVCGAERRKETYW
jgi:hypothetical protein